MSTGNATSAEPSIGIDLGTTNSAVATFHGGTLRIIERATGQRLLPSMMGFDAEGQRVVGEEARLLSETLPENVAFATKRLVGRRWTPELAAEGRTLFPFPLVAGPQEDVRVKLGNRVVPVVQVAAALLSELRADAEDHFNTDVRRAVITVPAAFNDAQRQATREAAELAGLEVMRLINEPTAAALAFGLSTGFTGKAVVFDLGGGTFDVSILDVRDGVFEVIATGGDPHLGGEDFDNVLVQWLLSHLTEPGVRERISQDRAAMQRLKASAEQAKKAVTMTDRARISVVLVPERPKSVVIETLLTRDFFERLVRPKTEQCLSIIEATMAEAKLDKSKIGAVLLVGGMTRIPLLRQMVDERVGHLPPATINPDEAVAFGAAMHAAELSEKQKNTLLLDVVGSTLSVGIAGGLVKPLIAKNTQLPCTVTELFHVGRDGQQTALLPVLQGEGMHAAENARLGEVKLEGLLGGSRTASAIEVRFELGVDGMLSVSASDRASGQAQTAKIVARTDLSPDERERLKKAEAGRHAEHEGLEPKEREKNRHGRRALHEVLVALRRVHRDLKLAAAESGEAEAKEQAESLGRQLVDAEQVEAKGAQEEVVALARQLRNLLARLAGVPG